MVLQRNHTNAVSLILIKIKKGSSGLILESYTAEVSGRRLWTTEN